MSPETTDASRIAKDIGVIVGGHFTPDHLGPLFNQISARARSQAAEYLRVFESLYITRPMNARAQSNLHLVALLKLLSPQEPARVRQLASALLGRYETAMSVADSLIEEEGSLEALPHRTSTMARRLNRRRESLRRLTQGPGTR
ncbi:MAG: hypothetical protein HY820_01540 [Acidobacteria bacterium]|nr:hypothetical protein [Acidobacteriota bacterium]